MGIAVAPDEMGWKRGLAANGGAQLPPASLRSGRAWGKTKRPLGGMAQEVLVWNDFGFAEALTYGLVERLTNVVENVVYVLNAH